MFNMGCDTQSLVSWHHGMGFNGSEFVMFEQSDGLTDKRILRQKKKERRKRKGRKKEQCGNGD